MELQETNGYANYLQMLLHEPERLQITSGNYH